MQKFLKELILCGLLAAIPLAGGYATARGASPAIDMKPGQACLECHALLNQKKFIHPASEEGAGCVTLCHRQADPALHQFTKPAGPMAGLCGECHEQPWPGAHQHAPVAAGECTDCHDPHQSDQAKLLLAPVGELCLRCHGAGTFSGQPSPGQVIHGPVKDGNCLACHTPHAGEHPKLLREPVPTLCLGCHAKPLEDFQGMTLPPTKRLFEDPQALLHPPFAAGDCVACHRPHAAARIRRLNANYPGGLYQAYGESSYALCLNCHDAEAFNAPRTLKATAFRNGNLNLHQRHVNKNKGRSCRACHSPHGSRQPHLLTAALRFGERGLGLSYEATASGGSCVTSCHVRVAYDRLAPVNNPLRTSPRQGEDATPAELQPAVAGQP